MKIRSFEQYQKKADRLQRKAESQMVISQRIYEKARPFYVNSLTYTPIRSLRRYASNLRHESIQAYRQLDSMLDYAEMQDSTDGPSVA
ncbi:MAG TPA: hypothetical protein VKR06_03925 [Ktedonosporobacter sp.]|nr:hypothetical protein [Ktedonosporobacter sp.]